MCRILHMRFTCVTKSLVTSHMCCIYAKLIRSSYLHALYISWQFSADRTWWCYPDLLHTYGLLPKLFSSRWLHIGQDLSFSWSRQGRSQVSKHDEASLERQRREPLGGSGSPPPPPRKFWNLEVQNCYFKRFFVAIFFRKVNLCHG